jgi:hypothetical protein
MNGVATQMAAPFLDNIVAGQVGSDTYVALDTDGNNVVNTVVKLTGVGINQLAANDFTLY